MAYTQRLYRSANDKIIAGIAGGMSEYFHIDPVFIRLGWFVSIFITGGISLLAYLAMAFIVPKRGYETPVQSDPDAPETGTHTVKSDPDMSVVKRRRRYILGICLVVAGVGLLAYNLDILDFVNWGILAAISVICVGAAIIYTSTRRGR